MAKGVIDYNDRNDNGWWRDYERDFVALDPNYNAITDDNSSSGDIIGGVNSVIDGLGSLYTNYNNQEYQNELERIRLERLKSGFDVPVTTTATPVGISPQTVIVGVGIIGALFLIGRAL